MFADRAKIYVEAVKAEMVMCPFAAKICSQWRP